MMQLFGRRQIFSDVESVTRENVLEVIRGTSTEHKANCSEIEYLYKYYKGDQPILYRTKDVRPEICNRIVENRANEIVSFKVGHVFGEPIQYISRSTDNGVSESIELLNDMMVADSKASKDRELGEWAMICGTAYRLTMAADGDTPFETVTVDPRCAYVIYSSKIDKRPLAGVYCTEDSNRNELYSVYTPTEFFEIKGGKVVKKESHLLGRVPLVEYPANSARLGAFEIVISLLDAINTVASNRIDGIEQFIQSLMKFINCDIDEETFSALQAQGAIKIKSVDGQTADVEIMTQELNQTQTETLVSHMYDTLLTICGMPNRNGGSSTSDTGSAVIMRDGWSAAEARAKDYELMFKRSERETLRVILRLCERLDGFSLNSSDIDIKFTRRNYENIQTKAQVLCEMLNNPMIEPKLAFAHCGMFTDPEEAYRVSMEWYKSKEKERKEKQVNSDGNEPSVEQTEKS